MLEIYQSMLTPEQDEEVKAEAEEKTGRPWSSLTEDEKKAIYVDYMGQRQMLDDQYAQANELMNTETPEGMQAGNVYVSSNPLSHIGKGIKEYRGAKESQRINKEREKLSEQYSMGSAAAGDVAANRDAQQMEMLSQMIKNQQAAAAPAPAAQPAQGQGQQSPQGPPPAQTPQQPQGPRPPLQQPNTARPPLQAAQNPGPMTGTFAGSGRKIPGNNEEWLSYMLRQQFGGR